MITRLYWYTAEYGLMQEAGTPLKAFGAGLMSSFTELQFAVESKRRAPRAVRPGNGDAHRL